MTDTKKAPIPIADEKLNEAQGGIALLVPAVQKVRDAAARTHHSGGVNVALGDGSVR